MASQAGPETRAQGRVAFGPPAAGRSAWRRLAPWIALVVLVAAAGGGAAWWYGRAARTPLQGAVLAPPVEAFQFTLPDQDGRMVSLAGLRGKVVVLTFLYANCPDICPLIAEQLRDAHAQLGPTAARAAFLAVSVDPAGDTQAAVRRFLDQHRAAGVLTYLRGSAAELQPVWSHYYVGSSAGGAGPAAAGSSPGTPRPSAAARSVDHTAIVYVIDPQGKIRVFLPGNLDTKDLVTDVRALAGQAR